MGKATGFLDFPRKDNETAPPLARISGYDEFHTGLDLDERRRQGGRCMNCGVPFCQSGEPIAGMTSGCPLHNLIPEWNDEVYRGNMRQALTRLLKTNNFPEFTGRVCPALCEAACTCGLNGQPVTVKDNECAVIDHAFAAGMITARPPKVRTGKKVAVIGSGPSGLAAADMLNRRGHSVTVYERDDRPGGLLMYGIPNMKLDKKIVDRRVKLLQDEGIRFVVNADVGKTVSAEEITASHDAVVLCCGAKNARGINAEGKDVKGVYFAVDYLASSTKSQYGGGKCISAKGKKVVVVGGGDTGNDCVGTAMRQGAVSVGQLEMMPKLPDRRAGSNPWPEWPRVCKTDYGQEEAIAVSGQDPRLYGVTVKELIAGKSGKLKKIKTVSLTWEKGTMKKTEGSERIIEADMLLIAAGFLGAEGYTADAFGVRLGGRGGVMTDNGGHSAGGKVFAAGDMRRGQSLVVWAIAEGRACAREVDCFLMGYTNLSQQ